MYAMLRFTLQQILKYNISHSADMELLIVASNSKDTLQLNELTTDMDRWSLIWLTHTFPLGVKLVFY